MDDPELKVIKLREDNVGEDVFVRDVGTFVAFGNGLDVDANLNHRISNMDRPTSESFVVPVSEMVRRRHLGNNAEQRNLNGLDKSHHIGGKSKSDRSDRHTISSSLSIVFCSFLCIFSASICVIAFMLRVSTGTNAAVTYTHVYFNCLYIFCIIMQIIQFVSAIHRNIRKCSRVPFIPEVSHLVPQVILTSIFANVKMFLLLFIAVDLRSKLSAYPNIMCQETSYQYITDCIITFIFNITIVVTITFNSKLLKNGVNQFQAFVLLLLTAVSCAAWADVSLFAATIMYEYDVSYDTTRPLETLVNDTLRDLNVTRLDSSVEVSCLRYMSMSDAIRSAVPSLTLVIIDFYLKSSNLFLVAYSRYLTHGPRLGLNWPNTKSQNTPNNSTKFTTPNQIFNGQMNADTSNGKLSKHQLQKQAASKLQSNVSLCRKCCCQPVVIIGLIIGLGAFCGGIGVTGAFVKFIAENDHSKAWLLMELYSFFSNVVGLLLSFTLLYHILRSYRRALRTRADRLPLTKPPDGDTERPRSLLSLSSVNAWLHKSKASKNEQARENFEPINMLPQREKMNCADTITLAISIVAGTTYLLIFEVSVALADSVGYRVLGIDTALVELAQMLVQTMAIVLLKQGCMSPVKRRYSTSEANHAPRSNSAKLASTEVIGTEELSESVRRTLQDADLSIIENGVRVTTVTPDETDASTVWDPIMLICIILLGFYNLITFNLAILRQEPSLYGRIFTNAYGSGVDVFMRAFMHGIYAFYRSYCAEVFFSTFIDKVKPKI